MADKTQIAWAAGIIDGEGCICGVSKNVHRKSGQFSVAVDIRVQTVSFAMISKLAQLCDDLEVGYQIERPRWFPKSTRIAHRINIRRRIDVVRFLQSVRPYLVVKKAEADLVLLWYQNWNDQRGFGKKRADCNEKLIFLEELRHLKRIA